ncbi:MAG: NAD(P)/FAD-dependent oxidoreductase, partial [Actinobacteria bacterium]|nr:NAD(P)/FAD-dependent oxidoreductase [Actinomycetota bacterium]
MSDLHAYDAIVIGGGHNGLTNAAYLAKAGQRVLLLEQRHIVGGAAITEELRPGFNFTTFSYALSLLRPEIIAELDLVRFGFMPLYMRSHFAPMANGDYFLIGPDAAVNRAEIARHSKADVDGMERFEHDTARVRQFVRPLFDSIPPNLFSDDPADTERMAWLVKHLGNADKKLLHDTVRLLTGSIADFVDDYLESDIIKATICSAACVGIKLGPMSPGSGINWLYLSMGEHDGIGGSWSFHKGGNGGFTQVLARAATAYG